MALSESGLAAQGILPGPMVIQKPGGSSYTVRAKSGSAPKGSMPNSMAVRAGGKQNLYVRSKSSRKGGRK